MRHNGDVRTVTEQQHPDRFQIDVDGAKAGFTQFVDVDGRRVFFHTEIDAAFEGQGLAGEVVREALDATRAEGLLIVPVCPYVKVFVRKHDDWADIVVAPTPDDLRAIRTATAG